MKSIVINEIYQITIDDLIIRNKAEKLIRKNGTSGRTIKEIDTDKILEMFGIDLDI